MPGMPTERNNDRTVDEPVIEPEDGTLSKSVLAEDTITFKRSHFYPVLTVLAFAVGILLGYVVWGDGLTERSAHKLPRQPAIRPAVVEAPVTAAAAIHPLRYPHRGIPMPSVPTDAPITIVEFSDYQCPFCRRWHEEVYEPLLAAYPGKIRFVYRNLPLTSIHPDAMSAAEAAMCAGEQDAYWQYP